MTLHTPLWKLPHNILKKNLNMLIINYLYLIYLFNTKYLNFMVPSLSALAAGWRDGSGFGSMECSSGGPRFSSYHPCGSSELPVMPRSITLVQTYMQGKHQGTYNKNKFEKKRSVCCSERRLLVWFSSSHGNTQPPGAPCSSGRDGILHLP